jgi:hypothetical protein
MMDSYERDWKSELTNKNLKNSNSLSESGYEQKYVPKTQVMSQEQIKQHGVPRGRKSSFATDETTKYMYVEKKK